MISKPQAIKAALLCAALSLFGCDQLPQDWELAPRNHQCTELQMHKVEVESAWCKANTTYKDTYCYSTAIMRNCTKADL